MHPHLVTITGASDGTPISELARISKMYAFVEWGILLGSMTGSRMPTRAWIERLVVESRNPSNPMQLSLHLCGEPMRQVLRGESPFLGYLGNCYTGFDRVQLNVGRTYRGEKQTEVRTAFEIAAEAEGWRPAIILQLDTDTNQHLLSTLGQYRCEYLFDQSGGNGILPDKWSPPRLNSVCGWAGGLSPDNLEEQLPKIHANHCGYLYWIDTETGVRTKDKDGTDTLDLDKVEKFLQIADRFRSTH